MKLSIVIPALNEEKSIAKIIERCLSRREDIITHTAVTEVDIVVVSDGSTDRTAAIANSYKGISTIVFEENRGYGAAIKSGWQESDGDLLAFLDADGTCDPKYFVPMCQIIQESDVDIVLGSRMGPESKMPKIRRIGNTIFAILLGFLSREKLTDAASGMRVVRKTSLERILPLPDGLHFTPAMSARALVDPELKVEEIPMHYEEREGRSKLSVIKDGIRFLKVIVSTAIYMRPSRLTMPVITILILVSLAVSIYPIYYYYLHRSILEWMIYRFLFVALIDSLAVTIFCSTIIAEHTIELSLMRYKRFLRRYRRWWGLGGIRFFLLAGMLLFSFSIYLVLPGLNSYVSTGRISPNTLHWSRVVVSSFFIFNFFQFLATASLLKIISALNIRQPYLMGKRVE
jgi:glycosyltransferase involved in cell wall biosynthesis